MTVQAIECEDEDDEDAIDGNEDEAKISNEKESIEDDEAIEELEVGESFV